MLLEELKERTRERHQTLENALRIEERINTINTYRELLERWYGWYAPWEALAMTKASPEVKAFLQDRWKTPLLESDLRALKGAPLAQLPQAILYEPQGVAEWVGALYVLEGSTLGGQLISRIVERNLSLTAARGCAFFCSYGDRVGTMWREFRDFAQQVVEPGETRNAAFAADQTFDSVQRWLCPEL